MDVHPSKLWTLTERGTEALAIARGPGKRNDALMKSLRFLIYSALIHMCLGLTLSLWHGQEESEQEVTAQQPVLVEIEYTEKDSQAAKKTSAAISQKESTPSKSSQKLAKGSASPNLPSLLAKETKAGLNAEHFENFDEKYNSNNLDIKGSGAWVEQLEFQRGLELTGMLKHIHDTLNAHILYPEDFLKMRFRGSGRGTHSYYTSRGFRTSILRPQC